MKRILGALTGLTLAITLTGCSGDEGSVTTSPDASGPTPSADLESDDAFNDSDVEFARSMIPHHAQAVEMAEIALAPEVEAGVDVTDLARRVRGAQDPEIQLMAHWLERWGHPMDSDVMADMGRMDHGDLDHGDMDHGDMDGMMTDTQMDQLRSARGPEFDRLWMELMIEHHEGAVRMAEAVRDAGTSTEAAELADEIIAAQRAEIDEMRSLLDS